MSNSFWMQDGKIIVADGAVIYCEDCPCEYEQDCYADLIAAIRERQVAAESSILGENAIIDLYTAIQEVNFIAPKFIGPLWTGGEVNPPVMLTNSYADSAATFCELYDLVRAMTHTTASGWPRFIVQDQTWFGQGRGDTAAEAYAAAIAAEYSWGAVDDIGCVAYAGYTNASETTVSATVRHSAVTLRVTGLPYSISKTVRITIKITKWAHPSAVWSDQGKAVVEDEWNFLASLSMGVGILTATSPPGIYYGWSYGSEPTERPDPGAYPTYGMAGCSSGDWLATVKWGFHHL